MKNICLLGSSGSIGVQALKVVREFIKNGSEEYKISSLAVHSNIVVLEEQIREFKPLSVAVFDEKAANALRANIKDLDVKVYTGLDGLCEIAGSDESNFLLNSVTGMIGLRPTLSAIEAKKTIALANKETLVAGGELVMKKAKESGVDIIPVDSEHSAIFQCLQGPYDALQLSKIIITASGGPFFGKNREELKNIKKEQALKHPNWDMGAKITIDSATMMNKGLEIIEAKWLFDLKASQIETVVHRESVIHSLVEFNDNSVLAQLGVPDMRIPIQYALTYPKRTVSEVEKLSLIKYKNLSFYEADETTFKCLATCKEALSRGGLATAAINGANEEAVKLFLSDKISFNDIGDVVTLAMDSVKGGSSLNLEDILEIDERARQFVNSTCLGGN